MLTCISKDGVPSPKSSEWKGNSDIGSKSLVIIIRVSSPGKWKLLINIIMKSKWNFSFLSLCIVYSNNFGTGG